MYLTQDRRIHIIPEEEFPSAIVQIEEELSGIRREGYFTGEGGAQLYYEYFLAKNPVGSVVFVHGLSEFTKKYYEFALYFINHNWRKMSDGCSGNFGLVTQYFKKICATNRAAAGRFGC